MNMAPGVALAGVSTTGDVWFWMSLSARFFAYCWATYESFHYFAMMKRRLTLGLVDVEVVDRFFYWGVSNAAVCFIFVNNAIRSLTIDMEWVRPVSNLMTAVLGLVVAATIFMAFFPRGRQIPDDQRSPAPANEVQS